MLKELFDRGCGTDAAIDVQPWGSLAAHGPEGFVVLQTHTLLRSC